MSFFLSLRSLFCLLVCLLRAIANKRVYHYCRLVTFSTGLQEVLKRGKLKEDMIFFPGVRPNGISSSLSPLALLTYPLPPFFFVCSACTLLLRLSIVWWSISCRRGSFVILLNKSLLRLLLGRLSWPR